MKREYLIKAASFCAYQERTQREVRERLAKWDVKDDDAEEVIAELIVQNYLNEERFARTFAGGKFRVKQWGKLKIKFELKMRGLSEYNIRAGLSEIDLEDYYTTIKELIKKKSFELQNENPLARKQKITRFLVGKGFESNLIWEILGENVED